MSYSAEIRPWPIRPRPLANESLSSWLTRIARIYRLDWGELVHLGMENSLSEPRYGLDFEDLPLVFLKELEGKTGVLAQHIQEMSLPGMARSILGQGVFTRRSAFENYHREFRVLTGPCRRSMDKVEKVAQRKDAAIPWLLRPYLLWHSPYRTRVCVICLKENGTEFQRLLWMTPLVHSCPWHEMLLCHEKNTSEAQPADQRLCLVDRLTMEATVTGWVTLNAADQMPAQVWFKFLRGLIFELSHCSFRLTRKEHLTTILTAWEAARLEPVQGKDYETMTIDDQARILTCVGSLIADWPRNIIPFVSTRHGAFAFQKTFLPWALARHLHVEPLMAQISDYSREFAQKCCWTQMQGAMDEFAYTVAISPAAADELAVCLVQSGIHSPEEARRMVHEIKIEGQRKFHAVRVALSKATGAPGSLEHEICREGGAIP